MAFYCYYGCGGGCLLCRRGLHVISLRKTRKLKEINMARRAHPENKAVHSTFFTVSI